MYRLLYQQLQGYRRHLVVAVGLTLAQVVGELFTALPVKFVLDKLIDHRDPTFAPLAALSGVLTRAGVGVVQPDERYTQSAVVLAGGLLLTLFALAAFVASHLQMRLAVSTAQALGSSLRIRLFEHIERLPLDWHVRQRSGDLIQRVTTNISDIEKLITDGLVDLLAGVLTLVGIVVVMAALSLPFTLVAVGVVPVLGVLVYLFTQAIKGASRQAARAAGRVAEVASEDIRAITEVKAFNLEDHEADRFAERALALRAFAERAGRLQAWFTPLVALVVALATGVIVCVGGYVAAGNTVRLPLLTIAGGSLTVGTLTVFLTYLKQLYQPIRNLSKLANMAATAASGAERISEILAAEPEARVGRHGHHRGVAPTVRLAGDVRFEGVAFGYDDGHPVLHHVDLDIPAGRRVALVGLSGAGKTTLVKLIPRFHEPWAGRVLIDGWDAAGYPLDLLRANISYVPQESVLFEGTILQNLLVGRPGASAGEVEWATRRAHVHDTILALPGGYDHEVLEGGKNLSAGQRQRLAIARALLRDAPIVLLDEPTASLDVEAEAEVMHAVDTLIQGRTVIMISHRLSTLGHVDEVVVLADGRIAERGTLAQLRASGGVLAGMLAEQSRYSGQSELGPPEVPITSARVAPWPPPERRRTGTDR